MREILQPSKTQAPPCPAQSATESIRKLPQEINRTANRHYYRGQGLALHSTLMAVVGGTLSAESLPGKYTRVKLTLPHTV